MLTFLQFCNFVFQYCAFFIDLRSGHEASTNDHKECRNSLGIQLAEMYGKYLKVIELIRGRGSIADPRSKEGWRPAEDNGGAVVEGRPML